MMSQPSAVQSPEMRALAEPSPAFRTPYRKLRLAYLRVAEEADGAQYGAPTDVPEELVKVIWFEQRLLAEHLRLADGTALSVLDPGWWNRAEGADFRRAIIRFTGGEVRHGDIEIHVRSSGWTSHGHHRDPRYNNVILHVVLWHDARHPTVAAQDGAAIPTLPLFPCLNLDLGELQRGVDLERYPLRSEARLGFCHDDLRRCRPEVLAALIDHAGDERLAAKADSFSSQLIGKPLPEVLYEALAEGMGLTNLRAQFRELANRVPWRRAAEVRRLNGRAGNSRLEALLFWHAGLLAEPKSAADSIAADYLRNLHTEAAELAIDESARPMDGSAWNVPGARPAGQPARRIAAFAELLSVWEMTELAERFCALARQCHQQAGSARKLAALRRDIERLMMIDGTEYWRRRVGLTSAPAARAARLVGEERARILLVNVLLPMALAVARRHKDDELEAGLHALYLALPKQAENSVVRFTRRRMLGDNAAAIALLNSTRRQQGIQQMFRDFCTEDIGGCLTCSFPALAGALRQLGPRVKH